MYQKLLAGLLPALSLSMGSLCNMMAEGVPDAATGGGAAPPAQPVITPVVVPTAPAAGTVPAVPAAAAAATPPAQTFLTHEEYRKGQAEQHEQIKATLQELLKQVIAPGQVAPPVPAAVAATPAPAAPPVPPLPPAPPPAPAPQPAPNLATDPAFLSLQGKHEEALAAQKKLSDDVAKMRSEKEAAEEKAKLIDTQIAVRKALENNQYRLTPSAVTTAAEMLMLKGAIGRGADGKLYINLGTDGTPKHELLDKGVTAWLDMPDGVVFRQAVPAGMGFQGSSGGGVPMSFPQGIPGRNPKFSQASFAAEMVKATAK